MSKIKTPNRIRAEDFSEEDRDLINKLSPGINDLQDDLVRIINNKGIDFENLNRQVSDFDVITTSTGSIQSPIAIKLSLRTKPYGIHLVRIININSPGTYPSVMPLMIFTFNDNILTITDIKGLTNSSKYHLYIEIIGT